jgi:hypothetical protein
VTHAQAADLFNRVRAAYPAAQMKLGHETADLWLSELRRFDYERGEAAVRSLIVSCKFWPSIAELHEQCRLIGEQQLRQRLDRERREADAAMNVPLPPLHEIPAAVELLTRFARPLLLDEALAGACDDCKRVGPRFVCGQLLVCGDCGRRRMRVAAQLDDNDAGIDPAEGSTR